MWLENVHITLIIIDFNDLIFEILLNQLKDLKVQEENFLDDT